MISDDERSNPFELGVLTAVKGQLQGTWTALPGVVESYNPDQQTVVVQPTIQAEVTAQDGSVSLATLPLLLDCPVQFPRGGGAVITFPVAKGDECLVVFASRCIDAWWQNGGVQPQAELRMHDLSDGFAVLGFSSVPNVAGSPSATAIEIRNLAGDTFLALDPTGQTVDITAPGGSTITADVTINGTLHVTGKITTDANVEAAGDVKAASISLKTHKHGGVQTGGSQTGAPV